MKKFNRQPKIVETISYDAIKVLASIQLVEGAATSRQTLEEALQKKETLQGESGSWKLNDDIWIKELSGFKIKRDGVEAI